MLFKSKHIDFIYQEDASDYLVVTFNAMNMRSNGKRFWGDSFLKKNGVAALGIMSTSPNWFPRAAMDEVVEAARPILSRYKHICTYGNSMGAYGAIKYSRLLGSQTTVAFSPQHTIDPSYKNIPNQFSTYFDPKLHQDMDIRTGDIGGRVYLFYDPFHLPDLCAANHIAEVGKVERIQVPFVGHTSVQIFARENWGMSVLQLCMERNMRELQRLTYRARSTSPLRPHHLSCALVPKHIRWALAICEKYPDVLEDKKLDAFCHALKRYKMTDVAIQWSRDAIVKNPERPEGFRNLAAFLRIKRNMVNARNAIEQALLIDPTNYRYMIEAGIICRDSKEFENAIYWFSKAVETSPRDPQTFMTLASFFQDQGLLDRAKATLQDAQAYHPLNSPIIEKMREIDEAIRS